MRLVTLARAIFVIALAILALSLVGCGNDGEMPSRMPDVEGETLADAVEELRDKNFPDILLFNAEAHAADPWDGAVPDDEIVVMTFPEPGDDAEPEVHLWVGERPEIPGNVPENSWYYPHGERIERLGTDSCLNCHEPDSCSVCHERRLEETDALLDADPAAAPDLAAAMEEACDEQDVIAMERGSGWFQVDCWATTTDAREVAAQAREKALIAIPVAFEVEPDAQTLVLRWLDDMGEPQVEIGFDRETYEAQEWDEVEASKIPWIADRYAVPSS